MTAVDLARQAWPTVGSSGTPNADLLAEYQRHDPSGREWVAVTYFTQNYGDRTEQFFGPVASESADVIRLDLGYRFPTAFLLRYATIRREA